MPRPVGLVAMDAGRKVIKKYLSPKTFRKCTGKLQKHLIDTSKCRRFRNYRGERRKLRNRKPQPNSTYRPSVVVVGGERVCVFLMRAAIFICQITIVITQKFFVSANYPVSSNQNYSKIVPDHSPDLRAPHSH